MKKKAIKIAAASAVAASAFVASAPLQSNAASNVGATVDQAVMQMQKAYHTYSDVTAKGQFADLATVYKEYNAAKTAYANATAAVKKAGGAQKDAYLAKLDSNYNTLIKKQVATYLDAYNYGTSLEGYKKDLADALTAKDWNKAEAGYHKISYELKSRTVILDRVYGKTARELLRSEFKASAQSLRDSIAQEVTAKIALAAAQSAVDSKNLTVAKAQLDKAAYALSLADKDSEFTKALVVQAATVNAAYEALVTPAVESVSAITSKSLKVTFNQAVNVTAADFTVKKGTMKANVAKVTISEDKKSATVELTSKFTKGDYTVTVANGTAAALTGSVTVEDEKVDKIEILSTSAPLSDADADTFKDDVTVGYKVSNQYGEDITKVTTVTPSASTGIATASNGVITVTGNFKEGDKTTVTLVQPESAKTATATLTASSEAKVAEVEVKGLYNADAKALDENVDLSKNTFYVEVAAKDQYGNDIKSASQLNSDVIINETNPNIVDVASSFTEITVNGTKKLVLAISNPSGKTQAVAGESAVTLISKSTGKNVQYAVKVAEAKRSDVVNLSQPNLVVVGEDAYVPAEVLDKDGNAITDVKVLNDATKGVKVTLGSTQVSFVEKDGGTYVKLPKESLTTEGPVALVAVSSTTKVKTLTLNVKAAAKPVIVTGLNSTFGNTFKSGETKTITTADLLVEDQYGRVMTEANLNTWLDASTSNKIVVTDDSTSTVVGISTTPGANTINASTESVDVVAGAGKGNENITITLNDSTGSLASSAKETTLRVTDGSEYKSYSVSPVGTVYDEVAASHTNNVAYDKAVKVYGVLNDGSKVLLTNGTDYTVSSTNALLNTDVNSDGVLNVNTVAGAGTSYDYKTGETEVKLPLTVTINATGEKLNQDVTISKVAPKVAKVDVVTEGQGTNFINLLDVLKVDKFNYDALTNGAFNFAQLDANADVVVTDQYGKSVILNGTDVFADGTAIAETLTLTKVSGETTFTNNGKATAAVTEIANASAFNVVLTAGSVDSAPIKVTATSAYSTSAAAAAAANATAVATAKANLVASVTGATSATSTVALAPTQDGANVTWTASAGTIAGGTFTTPARTAVAQTITLTATITKGASTATQTFTVTVGNNVETVPGTLDNATTITKN